jgi:hypothetical protein
MEKKFSLSENLSRTFDSNAQNLQAEQQFCSLYKKNDGVFVCWRWKRVRVAV